MSEQTDALMVLGIRDVLEVHQAGQVIGVQIPPEEVNRLLALVEHLRELAVEGARSGEDRQWIRLLTAADVNP